MQANYERAMDGGMAAPRVIRAVGGDLADPLVGGDLVQQFGQHGRISDTAAGDFDSFDLQCVGVDAKMHLAPLSGLGGPVFLGKPLPFTLGLDPGAVDQEMQGPVPGRKRVATVRPFWRRDKVLKSGTGQSSPASFSRLATRPVVCRNGSPNSAFNVRHA